MIVDRVELLGIFQDDAPCSKTRRCDQRLAPSCFDPALESANDHNSCFGPGSSRVPDELDSRPLTPFLAESRILPSGGSNFSFRKTALVGALACRYWLESVRRPLVSDHTGGEKNDILCSRVTLMLLFARNARPQTTLHLFWPIIQVPEVFEARQANIPSGGLAIATGNLLLDPSSLSEWILH